MKKIFTLIAVAFAALTVNAQTTLIDYTAPMDVPGGITLAGTTVLKDVKYNTNSTTVNCIQLANSYTSSGALSGNHIELAVSGGFKAGDVLTLAGFINNADETKTGAVDVFTSDGTAATVLYTTPGFVNGRLVADNPYEAKYSYTLAADAEKLYLGRNGNTGTNLVVINVVRAGSDEPVPVTESYEAVTLADGAYTASAEFANATIADGASTIEFGTAMIDVTAVGGATPKDVEGEPGGAFPGWAEWNDVKWEVKNQGDIAFGYIQGTGNPAVSFEAEEITTEGVATGKWRPKYAFYTADCGEMPKMGLYYKFAPKVNGELVVKVWSNKGNRNTYVVDEATTKPVAYVATGYINGQNEVIGQDPETGADITARKWLSAEEIQALHDNAKCQKDADGNIIPDTDSAPYVIGAGNQPFWGNVTLNVEAGKTYWLFQDSSQIGFKGYEFTYVPVTDAIENVAAPVAIQNNRMYSISGQQITVPVAGQIYIMNGKKYIAK